MFTANLIVVPQQQTGNVPRSERGKGESANGCAIGSVAWTTAVEAVEVLGAVEEVPEAPGTGAATMMMTTTIGMTIDEGGVAATDTTINTMLQCQARVTRATIRI
jgi:hypothetical protein